MIDMISPTKIIGDNPRRNAIPVLRDRSPFGYQGGTKQANPADNFIRFKKIVIFITVKAPIDTQDMIYNSMITVSYAWRD